MCWKLITIVTVSTGANSVRVTDPNCRILFVISQTSKKYAGGKWYIKKTQYTTRGSFSRVVPSRKPSTAAVIFVNLSIYQQNGSLEVKLAQVPPVL